MQGSRDGTDQNPIVLMPENLTPRAGSVVFFDPDGTPNPNGAIGAIETTGTQGDSTSTVPGASGCGPNGDGAADSLVNNLLHLPSPSGLNSLVLLDAGSNLALWNAGQNGVQWYVDWHAGFGGFCLASTTTTTTSTTTSTT